MEGIYFYLESMYWVSVSISSILMVRRDIPRLLIRFRVSAFVGQNRWIFDHLDPPHLDVFKWLVTNMLPRIATLVPPISLAH